MLPSELIVPTCGVVISKQGDAEIICSEFAVDMTTIVDPDDHTKVTAILLTCAKHSQDLEDGKPLVFVSEDAEGNPTDERLAVQFTSNEVTMKKEEGNTYVTE